MMLITSVYVNSFAKLANIRIKLINQIVNHALPVLTKIKWVNQLANHAQLEITVLVRHQLLVSHARPESTTIKLVNPMDVKFVEEASTTNNKINILKNLACLVLPANLIQTTVSTSHTTIQAKIVSPVPTKHTALMAQVIAKDVPLAKNHLKLQPQAKP